MSAITVKAFFDPATFTVSYVVHDTVSLQCTIIDSVLDFDQASGKTTYQSAEKIIQYITDNQLKTQWILETHVHADHLSAAVFLQKSLGGTTAISTYITDVQAVFKEVFNEDERFKTDGSQFQQLLHNGDSLKLGESEIKILHTPGHTPACLTFIIDDAIFVGDTLFMPDFGSARTDFPGGDAKTLYQSIQKILKLPEHFRLFTCHDYQAPGRNYYAWESTVAKQRDNNVHVKNGTSEAQFVAYRTKRDAELSLPKLILPSVQINMRAGHFPEPENNGSRYLKLPLNML